MSQRFVTSAIVGMPMLANYLKQQKSSVSEASTGDEATRRAICILDPQPNQTAWGVVKFEQEHFYSKTKIDGTFKGLSEGKHGFHIH